MRVWNMKRFASKIVRKMRLHVGSGPVLHFCGDSHLAPVRHAYAQGWLDPFRCRFTSVGGATAVGLRHPTSKTQALAKFRSVLLPCRRDVIPVFQLGEVDCGFVIWHRAKKYNESINEQLDASIEAYVLFINELRTAGYKTIIVTSAVLPTIGDGGFQGEVALLRKDINATQRQRTELTIDYNRQLARALHGTGVIFLDFTPDLIDGETRLIRHEFKHPDANDHHLDPERGGRLWGRHIKACLASLGCGS